MYKLLEDYLNEVLFVSKPKVLSFDIEDNTCIYVWKDEFNNDYTKSKINIWVLLEFIYSKISN